MSGPRQQGGLIGGALAAGQQAFGATGKAASGGSGTPPPKPTPLAMPGATPPEPEQERTASGGRARFGFGGSDTRGNATVRLLGSVGR